MTSKPAIVLNGAHHAREVMGVEVVLDAAETLLTKYGTDPRVTHWVDANEIWLVPIVNVDGSHKVDSGLHLWRKNTSGCPASGSCAMGAGVDLNRNYPFGWASCDGGSDAPADNAYRGPSAGSEPETQAFMDFAERIRPLFSLSYHSWAEIVLFPYGCPGNPNDEVETFTAIGEKMAARLPKNNGIGHYRAGHPWQLLYPVDGGANDWLFHDLGVYPFTVELNGQAAGFHPDYAEWRDRTVEKARASWQLLLDRADASGIRGIVRDASAQPVRDAAVSVETPRGVVRRNTGADGAFHVLVPEGNYTVKVAAPGRTSIASTVRVDDRRLDVGLILP